MVTSSTIGRCPALLAACLCYFHSIHSILRGCCGALRGCPADSRTGTCVSYPISYGTPRNERMPNLFGSVPARNIRVILTFGSTRLVTRNSSIRDIRIAGEDLKLLEVPITPAQGDTVRADSPRVAEDRQSRHVRQWLQPPLERLQPARERGVHVVRALAPSHLDRALRLASLEVEVEDDQRHRDQITEKESFQATSRTPAGSGHGDSGPIHPRAGAAA